MASLTEVQLLSGGVYGFGLIDDSGGPARTWFVYATEDEATAAHKLVEQALLKVVRVIGTEVAPSVS
jgi:hypothetical protein